MDMESNVPHTATAAIGKGASDTSTGEQEPTTASASNGLDGLVDDGGDEIIEGGHEDVFY